MSKNKLIKILFLMFLLITPLSLSAKDFAIKNDTNTFLYVNGTTGNVGIGTILSYKVGELI